LCCHKLTLRDHPNHVAHHCIYLPAAANLWLAPRCAISITSNAAVSFPATQGAIGYISEPQFPATRSGSGIFLPTSFDHTRRHLTGVRQV